MLALDMSSELLRFTLTSRDLDMELESVPAVFLSELLAAIGYRSLQLKVVRIQKVSSQQRLFIYVQSANNTIPISSFNTASLSAPITRKWSLDPNASIGSPRGPSASFSITSAPPLHKIFQILKAQLMDPNSSLVPGSLISKITQVGLIQNNQHTAK
eukprot:TRINITY_DN10576_c0_g1_i1.p1 TRINITY_DN10576_c0_g1~~TRINITY_DN10576_c0_g1_i1.p1  ORF type:complete len:157 (+),score=32.30 TRINITY_DN10576_c0_g1_i1:121-591(+)